MVGLRCRSMDSSIIRSLILKCNLTGHELQLIGLAGQVLHLAERQGIQVGGQHQAGEHLNDKVYEVVWGLILEGVFAPGWDWRNPNLPCLRLTEYGKKCVKAGETTPHDPDGYLDRLKNRCPSIDDLTLLYVGEALQTFRAGNHLATAVMIGVAAEQTLLHLAERVHNSLSTPDRQKKFQEATNGKPISKKHTEIQKRLKSPVTPISSTLGDVLDLQLDGIYDLIRRTRNDAGHPTGRKLDRYETHALLQLFSTYCGTVYDLMDWLAKNQI
jgi:hypothetical protein